MMKKLYHISTDERGVALLLVMVISAMVLAVMSAMIFMLTSATQISGLGKRYTTAVEASQGARGIIMELIRNRDIEHFDEDFAAINLQFSDETCAESKIFNGTSYWPSACNATSMIDIADPGTYDMKFLLGDYEVYAKVTETIQGNSGGGAGGGRSWFQVGVEYSSFGGAGGTGGVGGGGSATGSGGELQVQSIPYYYAIEIDARNTKDTTERARLSMLYQY